MWWLGMLFQSAWNSRNKRRNKSHDMLADGMFDDVEDCSWQCILSLLAWDQVHTMFLSLKSMITRPLQSYFLLHSRGICQYWIPTVTSWDTTFQMWSQRNRGIVTMMKFNLLLKFWNLLQSKAILFIMCPIRLPSMPFELCLVSKLLLTLPC